MELKLTSDEISELKEQLDLINILFRKRIPFQIILLSIFLSIGHKVIGQSNEADFSFIFMTDMHWTTNWGGNEAFQIAIDTANTLNADFVMTGGDLVFDVLWGIYEKSEKLFNGYKEAEKSLNFPV